MLWLLTSVLFTNDKALKSALAEFWRHILKAIRGKQKQ